MNNQAITIPENLTYNETIIPVPQDYEQIYVPIKPICEIIQTDYKAQDSWLKNDDYFGELYNLRYTVGGDGKRRKMNCLPIIDIGTWVASISNSRKSKKQIAAKTDFLKWYRQQLLKLFKGVASIYQENEREIHLLNKIEEDEALYEQINEQAKEVRNRINHNQKALAEVRECRFKTQYEFEFEPRLED